MDKQEIKDSKYGYGFGYEILTAILIVFLVSGLLPFSLALIHNPNHRQEIIKLAPGAYVRFDEG